MLQHQARLWNLLHTNALISTCQRHVPYASHSTTIQYAHACHAMQLDVYYRWLKIVTQIDIATCLWARYILMINSIPSAQMQTTHATCATWDMRLWCETCNATVCWFDATATCDKWRQRREPIMSVELTVEACVHVPRFAKRWLPHAWQWLRGVLQASLPTQQPMPDAVRKMPAHISTFVQIWDKMRPR